MKGDPRTLLEHAAEIDDDGFSDRVMRALPAPRGATPRAAVVVGFTTAACALSYVVAGKEALARGLTGAMPAVLLLGVMFMLLTAVTAIAAED
jgi:Domain of unknown function (DUF5056)